MSRIGKLPLVLKSGVKAVVNGQQLLIEGPKGKLTRVVRPEVKVELKDGNLVFTRKDDSKGAKTFHGTERALAGNMVRGVTEGFAKELEVIGVGYRADMKGKNVELDLGFSHPVLFAVPDDVKASVSKEGRQIFVKFEGSNKQRVGEVAAKLRSIRPPEVYKGKGVRYKDEVVKLKAGKAGKKA